MTINLKNSEEQTFNLWWRGYNLKLTKWCLLQYKETKDETYYQWAKTFGELSVLIKKNYIK